MPTNPIPYFTVAIVKANPDKIEEVISPSFRVIEQVSDIFSKGDCML
jgi:hypothetical protein